MLGFTPGERWEDAGRVRGIQMKAGSCDIMLNQDDFAKGRDRRKGEGFRVWVETAQDINAIAARVKAKGWPLDREPSNTPWGDWAFALTDPDGFKLTFIQAESGAPGGAATVAVARERALTPAAYLGRP